MTTWIHAGLSLSKSEIIYPTKKVCLIIIHRNTTHLLDMSCCLKHQQQRYHNENTKICIFRNSSMYDDILVSLTKAILIIFEHVSTYNRTPQTWIGYISTRQLNVKAFSFSLACDYLQRVTTSYSQIYKTKVNIKKNDNNAWLPVSNISKPRKYQRNYRIKHVVTCVVTHSSYGNTLSYGLSMFVEFENLPYPSVISISVAFHNSSLLLLWNLLNKKGSFPNSSSSNEQIQVN